MGTIFIILSVVFFAIALVSYQITGYKKIFISIFSLHLFSVFSAFGILLYSFLTDDFSNKYVSLHSAADLPLYYKISGLWAGQHGSLLLWMTMISLFTFLYFLVENEVSIFEIVIHLLNFFFLSLLLLLFYNPFILQTYGVQSAGEGINPVLLSFWMTVHPPITLLGYTFALICFSSSIRRMVKEEYFYDHDQKVPVVLVLLVLGAGIVSGCVWAYRTLGWGGFWGWDPVENASLIPWLLSLVYIHSSLLEKRYRQLIVHNNLVSSFIYVAVMIAVFLTRTEILGGSSVHSFGSGGAEKAFLAYIIFLTITILVIAIRYNKRKPSVFQDDYEFISHLSYAIISIGVFTAVIFTATVLPVFLSFFNIDFSVNESIYPKAVSVFAAVYIMSIFNYYYDNRSEDRMVLICSGIISFSTAIYFSSLSLFHYIIVYFSFMMFLYLVYKLVFHNRGSENRVALCTHITVMLFITASVLLNSETSDRYDLTSGQVFSAGKNKVEFSGYNEKSENIMFRIMDKRLIVPYYKYGDGVVTFPLILSEGLSDVYIEPERIVSAKERSTIFDIDNTSFLQWKDGFFVKLDNMIIRKDDISTANVDAVLIFRHGEQSEKVSVSMNFSGGKMTGSSAKVPFTGQKISLLRFSQNGDMARIYIEPDIFTEYKSDILEVKVGRKIYIKVIWGIFVIIIVLFFFLLVKTFTSYELY